jgi:hypothetical protein
LMTSSRTDSSAVVPGSPVAYGSVS